MDTITIGLNRNLYNRKFQTTRKTTVLFADAEMEALTLENQCL